MHRQCRNRLPRHRFPWKSLVSDPVTHHGTCVTYVPWCMSGSLTRGGGENVPGIPGACATRNFTYLARGPLGARTPWPQMRLNEILRWCHYASMPWFQQWFSPTIIEIRAWMSNYMRFKIMIYITDANFGMGSNSNIFVTGTLFCPLQSINYSCVL